VTGRTATPALLQSLTAQASLETGAGHSMYNYNFGGVKGASPTGQSASCLTHEVIGGQDVTLHQSFRAYQSLDDGAEDYVRVMVQRFGGAMAAGSTGNLDGFAHALKQAGYYTASETDYASALKSASAAMGAPQSSEAALLPVPSSSSFASSVDVSRLFDALSLSAIHIADPSAPR
jgi:flagellum-specific peptidoglycan hydrolase FlgJ